MILKTDQIKSLFYIFFLVFPCWVMADANVQTVKDLGELKQQAETRDLPILLMLTTQDCEYCEAIRVNYLSPMIKSGNYASTILIRQLYIDNFSYLRNEQGKLISGESIALKYNVGVTPTIMFIDSKWEELTDRIVGISGRDFFDELLSTRIHQVKEIWNKSKK